MKQIMAFGLILINFQLIAQTTYFNQLIKRPFPYVEGIYGLTESLDSGFIVPLNSHNYLVDTNLIHVLKLNKYGLVSWHKDYGVPEFAYGTGNALVISNSNILVSGYEIANQLGSGFLLELDINGDSLWMRRYSDGSDFCYFDKFIQTVDKGIATVGASEVYDTSFPAGVDRQLWVVKTDGLGTLEWQVTTNLYPNFRETGSGIVETLDSGFIVVGRTVSKYNTGGFHMLWLKISKDGIIEWQKADFNNGDDVSEVCEGIIPCYDGNFLIVGSYRNDPFLVPNDPWVTAGIVMKIDGNGNVLWKKKMRDITGIIGYSDMLELPDHSLMVTGFSNVQIEKSRVSLIKLTENADLIWQRFYDYHPFDDERFYSVVHTIDNGFAMAGDAFPILDTLANNATDGWILKVDSMGCESPICSVGTEEPNLTGLSEELFLFPNPATEELHIRLPETFAAGFFQLKMTNLFGQSIFKTDFSGGQTTINVSQLPPGPVFIQVIENGEVRAVGRAIIMR